MNETPENTELETRFFQAVRSSDKETVTQLVHESPDLLNSFDYNGFGGTPINVVIYHQDRSMIDCLLELGADPNQKSDWWAGPWNALQTALNYGYDDLAAYLVERGAEVGVHEAAGLNRLSDLARLLDSAPDRIRELGGDGCFPMHFAATAEVVDLLLERGADIDARDVDHFSTPAQYLAKHRPEVSRYLMARGAQADIFTAVLAQDVARVKVIIDAEPESLTYRINQKMFPPGEHKDVHNILTFWIGANATPLHAAASAKNSEIIRMLVESGMDVNTTGAYDEATPLHTAAWDDSLEVAKTLCELGADINRRSGELHNNSPAGWAIVAGSAEVFCLLMEQGAEVLPYFREDAHNGLSGGFDRYKTVAESGRQAIWQHLNRV